MKLDEIHEVERSKWDEIAEREIAEVGHARATCDLAGYVAGSPGLTGALEFLGDLRDRRVLEYGCGMGQFTLMLALAGARVTAFDLSPRSVDVTRKRLEAHGAHADVTVAAGEELPFPDAAFEVVVGESVLHHIDPQAGPAELARVIEPGGRAAFGEPMGMNPVLNFAREHLPYRFKAERGADVPLSYDDIRAWGSGFREVHVREVQLLSMVERLFGYDTRIPVLRRADDVLLRRVPRLRRYCRYVALQFVR